MNVASSTASAVAHPSKGCPYRGLAPFTEKDAPLFFGRDRDRDVLVANALSTRLTIYYGPSGAGKSSVLRAGLVNQLREEAQKNFDLFGTPEAIAVYFASWRDDPIPALLAAVRAEIKLALPAEEAKLPAPAETLSETLCNWSDALRADLIIVLDQFEEFFLYQHGIREQFARQFADILMSPTARVNFIISLREDALSRLDAFQSFVPRLFDNCLRLEHLGEQGARDAIKAPLSIPSEASESPHVDLEPELLDAVLQDVRIGQVRLGPGGATSASRIPNPDGSEVRVESAYLQLVMVRLWEECVRDAKGTLSLQKYESLARADGVVRTHLDKALSDFEEEERDIAARVFQYLVTPSGSKIAHWLDDLANWAKRPLDRVGLVLEKLSQPKLRILRNVKPADLRNRERYEIFHDVLASAILTWQQLYERGRRDKAAQISAKRKADREHAAAAKKAAEKWEQDKVQAAAKLKSYLGAALITALCLLFLYISFESDANKHAKRKADSDAQFLQKEKTKADKAKNAEQKAAQNEKQAREVSEDRREKLEAKQHELDRALEEAKINETAATNAQKEETRSLNELKAQHDREVGTLAEIETKTQGLAETVRKMPAGAVGTKSQKDAVVVWLEEIAALAKGDARSGTETINRIVQKEPEQLVAPSEGGVGWLYAGRINQEDRWGDQSFKLPSSALMEQLPQRGDIIRAGTDVNIRSLPNRFSHTEGWTSQPRVGLLKLDEFIEVQKVEEVEVPWGDPWRRIWVFGKKVSAPPPRWVEFWNQKGYALDANSQRIQEPASDPKLADDKWPGTNQKIGNDIISLKTGPRTWFIGYDEPNYRGSSIKVGPDSSIPDAVIPGTKRSRIESYRTFEVKPENWDRR